MELVKGDNCIHVDFYWNFKRNLSEAQELEEAELLTQVLLSANAYRKLTIGADALWSCYLPETFLKVFLREIAERKTKFKELCFDLTYLNDMTSRMASQKKEMQALRNASTFMEALGTTLIDNIYLKGLIIHNANIQSL